MKQVLQMLTGEEMCHAILKYKEEERERVEQHQLMFFKSTWLFSKRVRECDSGSCNEE